MRIGRSLCVLASVVAASVGTLVSMRLTVALGGDPSWLMQLAVVAGAITLALIVGAGVGFVIDRALQGVVTELERLRDLDHPEPSTISGPLAPVRAAAVELHRRLTDTIESSEARIRELEIQHNVAEAERQHIEAILHSLHDAVLVTDAFNELKLANERAAEVFGFDVERALHQPIDDVIRDVALRDLIHEERDLATPGHRKRVDLQRSPAAANAAPAQAPADSLPDPGPYLHYDVTLSSLPDAKKGAGGVVTILRDVTREREISQMKSDFVSKVSHELRTPLSSINAYVELLLDGEAADENARQEFYQIIKNEADRLNRLIDNMLNISRIEAGIIKIDRAEVDFAKAVERAVEIMEPQANLKSISLHVKTTPLACTALADTDMIHQVLLNLMSNAVKYTPEGGRVTISVENDDTVRGVLVTVADTGLGIPPEALPRVFDKFYRIENYKRVAKGTGLGLALVKHIVETVHHGAVTVSSELGMGSKFSFTIPYDDDAS